MGTRAIALGAALLIGTVALGACSSSDDAKSDSTGAQESATASKEVAAGLDSAKEAREIGATVIDVRTPEEYAEGHVADAELIDFQGDGFGAAVAALDPSVTYVVYCRSGNRSAQAAITMRAAGLTVLDGGAFSDMTAAGWPSS